MTEKTIALTGKTIGQLTFLAEPTSNTLYINIVNLGANSNSRTQSQDRSWFQARWVGK